MVNQATDLINNIFGIHIKQKATNILLVYGALFYNKK